jgi:hypothetical protein
MYVMYSQNTQRWYLQSRIIEKTPISTYNKNVKGEKVIDPLAEAFLQMEMEMGEK